MKDIGFGKSSLLNADWNLQLNDVEGQLLQLRTEIAQALAEGKLKCCYAHCYCGDEKCMKQLDQIRVNIIDRVNEVLRDASIGTLPNVLRGRM